MMMKTTKMHCKSQLHEMGILAHNMPHNIPKMGITPQNMPQTSLLSPTQSMVAKGNQW